MSDRVKSLAKAGGAAVLLASAAFFPVAGQDLAPLAPLERGGFGPSCDRECLDTIMSRYLDALMANDPAQLPVGRDVTFTENGAPLRLGDASWRTFDGLTGDYRLTMLDPESGQAAFFGVVEENGENAILSTRIKVRDKLIREIEQIVVRDDEAAQRLLERGRPDEAWDARIAPDERLPRDRMIAVANAYFSAIQGGAGTYVGFTEDCYRLENGLRMTGNPDLDRPGRPIAIHSMGCTEQLGLKGYLAFDTELRDRRFPVVDREQGIVFGHVFFDHAGHIAETTLEDGTVIPVRQSVQRPYSLHVNEIFKLESGRVDRILAAFNRVPYGMSSGWEGE